jgi:asparagine synthase (glutamine-hydrolysing)
MCAVVGFVDFDRFSDISILKKMTDVLSHRGPDFEGFFIENNDYYSIGLGHRRLSIIDLSLNGNQPMNYDDNIIIYNGEVYNFLEIKKNLELLGYIFTSNSDTEVILKAFHRWGINFVKKLNGMFVIVIYNKKKNLLYIIRDRVGVKPLFYYQKNNLFMFASEIKSFHKNFKFNKEVDEKSLSMYFQFGYILEPNTIFKNVKKLKAGYYLEFDLNIKKFKEIQYWDLLEFFNKKKIDISLEEAADHTEDLLTNSFKSRMISDVPVGVFLSGGYDSSTVAAILQKNSIKKIKTFTIGFKNKNFNEALYAKRIAEHLGTEHHEKYCTEDEAKDLVLQLPRIFDEPFGDSSAIPTILLSQFAKKHVKVSLSADGGDEIFGGYNKYDQVIKYSNSFLSYLSFFESFLPEIKSNIFERTIKNFNLKYFFFKNLFKKNQSLCLMNTLSSFFVPAEISNLISSKNFNYESNFNLFTQLKDTNDNLNKILAIDFKTYLVDDILTKLDRSSMNSSLEGRDPMLDHNIVEFIATLNSNFKICNGEKKIILKKIAHKYMFKKDLDRPKMGFSPPLYDWLIKDFAPILDFYFEEKKLNKQNILNVNYARKIYLEFINGKKENSNKIWLILNFLTWAEMWT